MCEHVFLSQVKTASYRSLLPLFFHYLRIGITRPDSHASLVFVLLAIHTDVVFFFTPYSSATQVFFFFFLLQCYATLYISLCLKCLFKLFILTKFTTVPNFVRNRFYRIIFELEDIYPAQILHNYLSHRLWKRWMST